MLSRRDLAILGLVFVAGIGLIVLSYFPFWPVMPFGPQCDEYSCPFTTISDLIGQLAFRLPGMLMVIGAMVVVSFSVPCFPSSDAK